MESMTVSGLTELWPAAGVSVRAGELELRWIDDGLAIELAALAGKGVHDEDAMPFNYPWTRGTPREVARNVLKYQWENRSRVSAERLVLEFGVVVGGRAVGIQSASGENWPVLREVETGSWLGREHQGKGIGRRMRALMLHFCFESLRAHSVTSTAFLDNAASNAVSRRTGYEDDGLLRVVREGVPATQMRYRMDRARWLTMRTENLRLIGASVEVFGVEALLSDVEPTRTNP